MSCLLSAKYTMTAEVLRSTNPNLEPPTLESVGEWVIVQDPITGDFIEEWKPVKIDEDPNAELVIVDCMVRGFEEGGIRVAGTNETFGKEYISTDFAKMKYSGNVIITKRDRITNIRDKRSGAVLWKEEELSKDPNTADFKSTIFNVNGVTPTFDPFGNLIENFALLARIDGGSA